MARGDFLDQNNRGVALQGLSEYSRLISQLLTSRSVSIHVNAMALKCLEMSSMSDESESGLLSFRQSFSSVEQAASFKRITADPPIHSDISVGGDTLFFRASCLSNTSQYLVPPRGCVLPDLKT
jgi:hypothetical protein